MSERRGWHVGVAVALVVAGMGVFAGVRGTGLEATERQRARLETSEPMGERALAYAELRGGARSPNVPLAESWWRGLPSPDAFAPVVFTDEQRQAARARRAARRAYDGAPPTVPHPVDQLEVPACLACHERGAKIAQLVAPKMSHAAMGSCVQCHVASEDPRDASPPGAATLPPATLPDSSFVGVGAPGPGERAWPGAPPLIPHTTWMRERCDSCHGVFGDNGLRSTHPWRQSCQQCHAPSAVLDQRPVQVVSAPEVP